LFQRLLSALNTFLLALDNQDGSLSSSLQLVPFTCKSRSLAAVWPRPLPTASDWCRDVTMSSIRTISSLFLHVVNQLKQTDSSLTSNAIDCRLQAVTSLLLENCPVECLSSLSVFLNKSLCESSGSDSKDNDSRVFVSDNIRKSSLFSECFPDVTFKALKSVAKHPNLSRLEELAQRTCCEKGIKLCTHFIWQLYLDCSINNVFNSVVHNGCCSGKRC